MKLFSASTLLSIILIQALFVNTSYGNNITDKTISVASSSTNDTNNETQNTAKNEKKVAKQTIKKNKVLIKKVKKDKNAINKRNKCKKGQKCNTKHKNKISKKQKHNVKKIIKMNFIDDNKIIALIDEQQQMVVSKKQIQVRTKNKGVSKICLPPVMQTKTEIKHIDKKLEDAKKDLKNHIKNSLIANDVNKE